MEAIISYLCKIAILQKEVTYSEWCMAINTFLEAGQTQTVIARQIWINKSQVSRLIAKCRQTNDVTDRLRPGRPIIISAADIRVLVRSAVRNP